MCVLLTWNCMCPCTTHGASKLCACATAHLLSSKVTHWKQAPVYCLLMPLCTSAGTRLRCEQACARLGRSSCLSLLIKRHHCRRFPTCTISLAAAPPPLATSALAREGRPLLHEFILSAGKNAPKHSRMPYRAAYNAPLAYACLLSRLPATVGMRRLLPLH